MLCLPIVNITLFFSKIQCVQNFILLVFYSSRCLFLLNSVIPFLLICPSRICQSFMTSSSIKEEVETSVSPITMKLCKMYNYVEFFYPFMITRVPRFTFKILHSPVYLWHFESSGLKYEILLQFSNVLSICRCSNNTIKHSDSN